MLRRKSSVVAQNQNSPRNQNHNQSHNQINNAEQNTNSSNSSQISSTIASEPRSTPWRIKDFLKLPSAPKGSNSNTVSTSPTKSNVEQLVAPTTSTSISNTSANSNSAATSDSIPTSVSGCYCCGTLLTYPTKASKFRCSVCNTTNILAVAPENSAEGSNEAVHIISYDYVKKQVEKCLKYLNQSSDKSIHEVFEPLSDYLYDAFKNYHILSKSFKTRRSSQNQHYHTSKINYEEIHNTFLLLSKLPTKRPLYNALRGASHLLKRVYVFPKGNDASSYVWVLILMEIPFLSRSLLSPGDDSKAKSMIDVPEIKGLCYDILKRCIGILACIESVGATNYITSWYANLPTAEFAKKVDLLNLYITFHLKKYFYIANNPHLLRRTSSTAAYNASTSGSRTEDSHPTDREYSENVHIKEEIDAMNQETPNFTNQLALPTSYLGSFPARRNSKKNQSQEAKIKIYQYGNDWHIKTAAISLSFYLCANTYRVEKVSIASFYNSLVDFVNIKLDFDSWQTNKKSKFNSSSGENDLQQVIDYINGSTRGSTLHENASYYFCQYPFLITLGGKISILEYEARRQMERKAEEAFINSLDKRVALDIYFKVKVRRENIVQDSISAIKNNSNNLKKSLRVQFVNEPGVDVGGLKKEWFLLLTRALFNPQAGMVYNIEDSNYLWFNLVPIENFEMYYLLGAVLGLAIYNSTILDLHFPMALYKILLDKPVGLDDYKQLFPVSYGNLMKLKKYSTEELLALDLTFEVSYQDLFGKTYSAELIKDGRKIFVTAETRKSYIEKYTQFFLQEGIKKQITAFSSGFKNVIGGNGLSLFLPEEIQLLLCGSEEGGIDVDVLKSVTKYVGWKTPDDGADSTVVQWFWEYMCEINTQERKRLLMFVTGSDRVPATGIQNLSFKISSQGKDSNRLPVAHTCFNELGLYNYSSKEKLVDKLVTAVNESAGFGLK
ncbi:hypothetical protein G9P44_001557 [Scheffersomyces stipitis]|nr:hypothetical protein G9P44_001557 [Scheffersomyces stipitis]